MSRSQSRLHIHVLVCIFPARSLFFCNASLLSAEKELNLPCVQGCHPLRSLHYIVFLRTLSPHLPIFQVEYTGPFFRNVLSGGGSPPCLRGDHPDVDTLAKSRSE